MKKLILICALLIGGSAMTVPTLYAAQEAPMCSFDDPCLFDGTLYDEDGRNGINVVVKHNKKGQVVAIINGDINNARLCVGVANSKQFCFTYNNRKYYFPIN